MKKNAHLKTLFLFLFILGNLNFAYGKEWKPGYAVTYSNDTLRGLIAYSGGGKEWEYCTLKSDENAAEQFFLPSDIKKYTYESGLCYKAMNIQVGKMKGLYFVRSIVEGLYSLSYLNIEFDADSTYSVYLLENGKDNKTFRIPAGDMSYSSYRKRLKSVLLPFFNNDPVMKTELENSNLTVKGLVSVFEKYNSLVCGEESCVTYAEIKKTPPRFFISTRLLFQYAGIPGFDESKRVNFLRLGNLKFNAGAEIVGSITLMKHSDLLLLNLGLGFMPLSLYPESYRRTPPVIPHRPASDTPRKPRGLTLTNNLSLEVHWFNKRVSPSLEFGVHQLGALISNGQEIRKYYFGFFASAGLDIQINEKCAIPIRFGVYQTFSNGSDNAEIRSGRYQLSVGYTFRTK